MIKKNWSWVLFFLEEVELIIYIFCLKIGGCKVRILQKLISICKSLTGSGEIFFRFFFSLFLKKKEKWNHKSFHSLVHYHHRAHAKLRVILSTRIIHLSCVRFFHLVIFFWEFCCSIFFFFSIFLLISKNVSPKPKCELAWKRKIKWIQPVG